MGIDWTSLYEKPAILTMEWGHERIFAPQSYANIRMARALPVIVEEAALLAQSYPLCWACNDGVPVLVALFNLLPENKRRLGALREGLPMVAQAYPFVVPDAGSLGRQQLFVDRTVADLPTDIGAPLILDNGKLSKASLLRGKKALVIGRALPLTLDLTQDLAAAGFLEPWPLHFDLVGGARVDLDDFLVIAPKKLADPALYRIVETHGVEAGLFLGLHRISLFRIMHLLNSAKALLQREKPPVREKVLQ